MRCPTLNDLPTPPPGKTGWPWTEESPQLPDRMPDGSPWPRISIVTPSYNQGQFIEETIRSVLLQGYPDLEYIVMDGGSKDGTVEIIKKYEHWINDWTSKKDHGQSDAINKGLRRATGQIVAWINSDDYFWPGIFHEVAKAYRGSDLDRFWVVFAIEHFDQEADCKWVTLQTEADSIDDWLIHAVQVNQQGAFWSRSITSDIGLLDESMHLGMDTEYFMRMVVRGYAMERINEVVAGTFRIHENSKTGNFHGEIVDRSQAFLYDWTLARLRHLPIIHARYRELNQQFCHTLAYCEIRFGQNRNIPIRNRLGHLAKALRWAPSSLFSRAFLGGVRRLVVS